MYALFIHIGQRFCLESKIRHSTIDTVPYFYVQRLIKKYGIRYFYQRSIC